MIRSRSQRGPRPCAILVASDAAWVPAAQRIFRTHGYAVANLADLEYADLLVGPGELRVVVVDGKLHRPPVAAQIARLRGKNAGLLVVVLGDCARGEAPTTAIQGDRSVYLPGPFDGDQLRRLLPLAAPDSR